MHPTPILATFSNISGRPKDMQKLTGDFLTTQFKWSEGIPNTHLHLQLEALLKYK